MNGKGSGKEAEMTAGHNSYVASATADPGPGGATNAFSSLTTLGFPRCLTLIFTSEYSSEPRRTGTAQMLVAQRSWLSGCRTSGSEEKLVVSITCQHSFGHYTSLKKQIKTPFHNSSDLIISITATFLLL